jgi:hypothetical protein
MVIVSAGPKSAPGSSASQLTAAHSPDLTSEAVHLLLKLEGKVALTALGAQFPRVLNHPGTARQGGDHRTVTVKLAHEKVQRGQALD